MIYDWPSNLQLFGVGFNPRGMTVAGPVSLTGFSQVLQSDAGYWVAIYERVWAMDKIPVLTFRAFRALLEGGANQVRLPVFDVEQQPWRTSNGLAITTIAQTPHDDDALFDDNTGYQDPPLYVLNVGAAAEGATQITADFLLFGTLWGGEYFTHNDHLYIVRQVLSENGTQKTLFIWPRLREAMVDGDELNFYAPTCKMRLMGDAEMDLQLEIGRFGSPTVNFTEVL